MGHPRKARKKYDTPPHPWNAERIKTENKLMSKYGLKNKKEIWKADTLVRKYSREARYLLGFSQDQVKVETEELARMFVVHGHIALNGKKLNSPSYVVKRGEEEAVGFYHSSPVAKQIEEYNKAATQAGENQ